MFGAAGLSGMANLLARLALSVNPLRRQRRSRMKRHAHALTHTSGISEGRCGCCPDCHEFVYIELSSRYGDAPCPRCRRLIRSVDPLGPAEPVREI
jgi:hypothetical protein